jgi:outer membrane protein OmpA-like peptidoglycan-associated protein
MKKWLLGFVSITSALSAVNAAAIELRYVATPTQSKWELVKDSPLECRLSHYIPNFGDAEFTVRASKKINMDFELKMLRPMGETREVSLISMPPTWRPGEGADSMTELQFFQQFDGYIGGQTAWSILSELEKGRYPTFSYNEWQSRDQRVEIALSSVLFKQSYHDFSQCVSRLLPYSFDDISFTILHYDRDSVQVNKASLKRLAQIAEYIRHNQDIDLVLVSTYTASDVDVSKSENQSLSDRRAKVLQDYFKSLGLPEDRIEVQGYGQRRAVADDGTPIGKDKNRRVVISLGRSQV